MSEEPTPPETPEEVEEVPADSSLTIKVEGLEDIDSATDPKVIELLAKQQAQIAELKAESVQDKKNVVLDRLEALELKREDYEGLDLKVLKGIEKAMIDTKRFEPIEQEEEVKPSGINPGYRDSVTGEWIN